MSISSAPPTPSDRHADAARVPRARARWCDGSGQRTWEVRQRVPPRHTAGPPGRSSPTPSTPTAVHAGTSPRDARLADQRYRLSSGTRGRVDSRATTDPQHLRRLTKREQLVLERLSQIPQRRHEPSEVHPVIPPQPPCLQAFRTIRTRRHQRTAGGHQRTPDGQSTVTKVTYRRYCTGIRDTVSG